MANENQKFLTSTEVVDLAISRGTNFDEDLLDRFILPAQRKYMRNFLGKDYYEDILAELASSLTADTSVLLNDYLKQALAHYVVYVGFESITLDLSSKGVLKNTSETSVEATPKERANAREHYLYMAEIWENDAEEYICDQRELDSTKYSEFKGKNNKTSQKTKVILYDTKPKDTKPSKYDCL